MFHDIMSCVLEQQIHYRSTKKTFQKMLAVSGLETLTPDNFEQLEERGLATAKLATSKYETIERVRDFFEQSTVAWERLEDDAVRDQLIKIKGVSHWTVDMLLLYTLERDDVFPADDYHLKQIMSQLYPIRPGSLKADMKKIAEKWSPYRSLAVRYLLAWKDTQQ